MDGGIPSTKGAGNPSSAGMGASKDEIFGPSPRDGRRFHGVQTVAPVESIDAFVRAARPGDRLVYCEAPELIRCETSRRAAELAQAGLVRTHQVRRQGGGFTFLIVRTGYKLPRELTPAEAALADPFTAAVFAELQQAARAGRRCPSDAELARRSGLASRDQAQWRVRKLADAGLIESVVHYRRGVPARVVTILGGGGEGTRTALPGEEGEFLVAAPPKPTGGRRG